MKEVSFLSSPPLPRSFTCAIFRAFLVPRSLLLNRTETLATQAISRRHHWFPGEMTSEKRAQKFYTEDASLPTSG